MYQNIKHSEFNETRSLAGVARYKKKEEKNLEKEKKNWEEATQSNLFRTNNEPIFSCTRRLPLKWAVAISPPHRRN